MENLFSDIGDYLDALEKAVDDGDKRKILEMYDQAQFWELDSAPEYIGERYDELVEKGNNKLGI